MPTYGSKEAIFSFAQVVVDPARGKDVVLVTEPGYPVPERGAAFAGARVVHLPLREESGFLPDLDAIDEDTLARTAILWLNYPNNPTAAVAPLSLFERAARLARGARLPRRVGRGLHGALVPRAAAVGAAGRRPLERRRLQHAQQALLDDGLPLGLRRRTRVGGERSARLPADRGHGAPGVRPAGVGRRVERRGARGASPRRLRPQARGAVGGARCARLARGRERGDDVPVGRDAGGRELGGARGAAARARDRGRSRRLSRLERRRLCPHRARPHRWRTASVQLRFCGSLA